MDLTAQTIILNNFFEKASLIELKALQQTLKNQDYIAKAKVMLNILNKFMEMNDNELIQFQKDYRQKVREYRKNYNQQGYTDSPKRGEKSNPNDVIKEGGGNN